LSEHGDLMATSKHQPVGEENGAYMMHMYVPVHRTCRCTCTCVDIRLSRCNRRKDKTWIRLVRRGWDLVVLQPHLRINLPNSKPLPPLAVRQTQHPARPEPNVGCNVVNELRISRWPLPRIRTLENVPNPGRHCDERHHHQLFLLGTFSLSFLQRRG
jgi:hypothetical protein